MENDTVLRMIRQRVEEMEASENGAFGDDQAAWNIACERLYIDMIAEGLEKTAEAILSHRSLQSGGVIDPLEEDENQYMHFHGEYVDVTKGGVDHADPNGSVTVTHKITMSSKYGKTNH